MTLKTLIKNLKETEKEFGGKLEVLSSSDIEGNEFNKVFYTPSELRVKDLTPDRFDGDDFDFNSKNPNAIIIN